MIKAIHRNVLEQRSRPEVSDGLTEQGDGLRHRLVKELLKGFMADLLRPVEMMPGKPGLVGGVKGRIFRLAHGGDHASMDEDTIYEGGDTLMAAFGSEQEFFAPQGVVKGADNILLFDLFPHGFPDDPF